jgi:ABC-2 type transport system permease protein
MRAGEQASQGGTLAVRSAGADNSGGFDWMAYMAPSMAVLFPMFTVSLGARSVLAERRWGIAAPAHFIPRGAGVERQMAIFLTGLAQW